MSNNSKIQWTESSWNPIVGCTKVSDGCYHCYAINKSHRCAACGIKQYVDITEKHGNTIEWTGEIRCIPELLNKPIEWKNPRRIFVNSMSDFLHKDVPMEFLASMWNTMSIAHQHTYQLLTKRADRLSILHTEEFRLARIEDYVMRNYRNWQWYLSNVWIGVSVENQRRAYGRLPLLATMNVGGIRWISAEPLLEKTDLFFHFTSPYLYGTGEKKPEFNWVVIGGESGPGARPFEIDWARSIISKCKEFGIPIFMKQVGSNAFENGKRYRTKHRKGGDPAEWPEDIRIREYP